MAGAYNSRVESMARNLYFYGLETIANDKVVLVINEVLWLSNSEAHNETNPIQTNLIMHPLGR